MHLHDCSIAYVPLGHRRFEASASCLRLANAASRVVVIPAKISLKESCHFAKSGNSRDEGFNRSLAIFGGN
jgi:hypothetical protein